MRLNFKNAIYKILYWKEIKRKTERLAEVHINLYNGAEVRFYDTDGNMIRSEVIPKDFYKYDKKKREIVGSFCIEFDRTVNLLEYRIYKKPDILIQKVQFKHILFEGDTFTLKASSINLFKE